MLWVLLLPAMALAGVGLAAVVRRPTDLKSLGTVSTGWIVEHRRSLLR